MATPNDPEIRAIAEQIGDAVPTFLRLVVRRQADRAKRGGTIARISLPQYVALDAIGRGPLTVSALADAMGVGVSSATRMVQGLARLGYVLTGASPSDRRVKLVTLTPEGDAARVAQRAMMVSTLAHLLQPLDHAQRMTVADGMDVATTALNYAEPGPAG